MTQKIQIPKQRNSAAGESDFEWAEWGQLRHGWEHCSGVLWCRFQTLVTCVRRRTKGLGRSGGDLGREGQGLGFHGARVSQSRWPIRWRLRCGTKLVAAALVDRQSRESRSSRLVLWCARTESLRLAKEVDVSGTGWRRRQASCAAACWSRDGGRWREGRVSCALEREKEMCHRWVMVGVVAGVPGPPERCSAGGCWCCEWVRLSGREWEWCGGEETLFRVLLFVFKSCFGLDTLLTFYSTVLMFSHPCCYFFSPCFIMHAPPCWWHHYFY